MGSPGRRFNSSRSSQNCTLLLIQWVSGSECSFFYTKIGVPQGFRYNAKGKAANQEITPDWLLLLVGSLSLLHPGNREVEPRRPVGLRGLVTSKDIAMPYVSACRPYAVYPYPFSVSDLPMLKRTDAPSSGHFETRSPL